MDSSSRRLLLTLLALTLAVLLGTDRPAFAIHPGAVDQSFGNGGELLLGLDGQSFAPSALALRPDGALLVIGTTGTAETGATAELVLMQRRPDGTPDPSFGTDGVVRTTLPGPLAVGAAALEPGGGVVLAGSSWAGPPNLEPHGAVVRLLSDGSLDRGFGDAGMATVDVVDGAPESLGAVGLETDGAIVVGGRATYSRGASRGTVARLTPAGALDPGFMLEGRATLTTTSVAALVPSNGATLAFGADSPVASVGDGGPALIGLRWLAGPAYPDVGGPIYSDPRWSELGIGAATPLPEHGALVASWARERGAQGLRRLLLLRFDEVLGRHASVVLRDRAVLDDVGEGYRYAVGIDGDRHAVVTAADLADSGNRVALTRVSRDDLDIDRSYGHGGRAWVSLRGPQQLMAAAVAPDGATLLLARRPSYLAGVEQATLTRVAGGRDHTRPRVSFGPRTPRCARGRQVVRVVVRDDSVLDAVVVRRGRQVVRRSTRTRLTLRVRPPRPGARRLRVAAKDAAGNIGRARLKLSNCPRSRR